MLTKYPTISALRNAYLSGNYTPIQAVADAFAIIDEKDKEIQAFLELYREEAKHEAVLATERLKKEGDNAPALLGVPIAIKNNILIKGKKTTASSKMLENYVATYDATIIERLREAGAIFIGATNMDEFAMGSSTENSAFMTTKNPYDTKRVPGGSSGGSAASVAMGAVTASIGTDTGGSIRQPASYCGLVGLKPTYGAVSRNGLIAMGSSLDQAGPLTRSVLDAEIIHCVMAGLDPKDATTIAPDTYPDVPVKQSYTIGVPRSFFEQGIDTSVMKVFDEQLEKLAKAGHKIEDIELPLFEQGLAAYYIVMPAEVSSNLARFDGMRYGLSEDGDTLREVYGKTRATGFGAEVKRRILLGAYVLSSGYYDAYYRKAEAVRSMMRKELTDMFQKVDLVLTPSAPTPAFVVGEFSDPLSVYKQDIFTVPVNLTGVPAISVPADHVEVEGKALPVGMQFIAPHQGESRLFDIGIRAHDKIQGL